MNKVINKTGRYISFLICLSLLIAIFIPVNTSADESGGQTTETVKAAWYEDSYHISGENGERRGYAYEYEQALSAYTGWNYDYIKGDWGELLKKLQNGEIDMMAAISYTDERAETMLFSELPMGNEKYYLYLNLANVDFSMADLSDLNGKRIAVMEESIQGTQFAQWENEHNVQTQHIDVDSFTRAKEMSDNKEIDGVISTETPAWVEAGMSAVVSIGGSDIYYAINKNRPDLKNKIDNAMRSMENDKPFYADELYERYLATQSVAVLSSKEKEWIKQHGVIRIGYINNDPGFSVINDKNGKPEGVIKDYIEHAQNCLGNHTLDFELIGFDSEAEQIQAIKDDRIDMIFHVSYNPYYAEMKGLSLSNIVLTMPLSVVTSHDSFDESAKNKVAIAKNDTVLKSYVAYNYPTWEIVECDSLNAAKKMVLNGETDCFVARSGQSAKYINNRKLHTTYLTQACDAVFAVNNGDETLLSILNKTLKTIQTSKLSGAVSAYEDSLQKVTIEDFIKDNMFTAVAVFMILVILIMGIIIALLRKAQKAMQLAENANAAKSNFLFNMSHDIRTPMNAILGYNELMKENLTDPKMLDYQEKIEQSGNLLLSIINNVLDMARIESGKLSLDENYSEVGAVLNEVCEVFEMEARKKGISLTYETDVKHMHILCDDTKVKEIFTNLISNAVKYTSSGGKVVLRTKELPCNKEGYVRLKTEITDTGIGMSKEYLPYLFESFTRERNTTTGKIAGTGLGMPIVKRLVELMGGSIDVESELGKGTKFTVILQHKIADEAYYIKPAEISDVTKKELIRGKHVLLAEDNELNAEIAVAILQNMGIAVDCVEDGVQCVAKIEQMPAGSYDLILMDIQMPNMDGYKATQAIRRFSDKDKADIPIIAMTANAFEEDKKMALSKGMNGHIAKPIDVHKIEKVIVSVLK
ncbi:MAG: transporter substrate-binding domain-containing protein [Eubacteriales bacterium]|nr:transporter substrate-binding domain-containing protein [Eubacteriales bacterium]